MVIDNSDVLFLESQRLGQLIMVDIIEVDRLAFHHHIWIVQLLAFNVLILLINIDAPRFESDVILELLDQLVDLIEAGLWSQLVPCQCLLVTRILCEVLRETCFLTQLDGKVDSLSLAPIYKDQGLDFVP